MRTFRDAKAMAKALREALAGKQIDISHSEALEIVAAEFGFANWNVLAARIEAHAVGAGNAVANNEVTFGAAVPVVRMFSVEKAKEFYLGYLGFKLDWEHHTGEKGPVYMQLSRSGVTLHLSEHHGDGSRGSVVYVTMSKIDRFLEELREKNYPFMNPAIEELPWGRETAVTDPFSNRIRFCETKAAGSSV
jgi:hypothetical protein